MTQICDPMSQTVISGHVSWLLFPQATASHFLSLMLHVCSGEQSSLFWQYRDSTTRRDCIKIATIARMLNAAFIFRESLIKYEQKLEND